jgi:hypothetical protein
MNAAEVYENPRMFQGKFQGLLPISREFEFKLTSNQKVIHGKIAENLGGVEEIRRNLFKEVSIEVKVAKDVSANPPYLLLTMPEWPEVTPKG